MVGSPRSPRTIGSPGWASGGASAPVEAPVRLVGRPGVGGRFGEVEEGVDVGQRRLVDVWRVDRLEVPAGEGRIGRVDDEPDAGRGEGAGGDQVKSRPTGPARRAGRSDHGGVDQDDGVLSPGLMWVRAVSRSSVTMPPSSRSITPWPNPTARTLGAWDPVEAASSVPMAARVPGTWSASTCTWTLG